MLKNKYVIYAGLFLGSLLVINVGMYFFLNATQPKSVTIAGAMPNSSEDSTAHKAEGDTTALASAVRADSASVGDSTVLLAQGAPPKDVSPAPTPADSSARQDTGGAAAANNSAKAATTTPPRTQEKLATDTTSQGNLTAQAAAGDVKQLGKLAKMLDAMKPAEAASIVSQLDVETIVSLVMRMKDRNAAKMLAALPVDQAARVATRMSEIATVTGGKL